MPSLKPEDDGFFHPVSGFDLPRFAGVPTFMRLPYVPPDHPRFTDVEIGLIGIPWDAGTTNRPGPRHGPRQLRDNSTMIRAQHPVTGHSPFTAAKCADLGDVGPNPTSIEDTLERVTAFYDAVVAADIRPLTAGGDHLSTLPVLRALGKAEPLGLVLFDSHTDLFDSYFGEQIYTHGTPFRRAVEEGLLDPKRIVQIGIRGTNYGTEDIEFAIESGIRIIRIEEVFERGIPAVMAEAREIVGDARTYVSFDIDFLDPAYAPGTGTPEIGGPTSFQGQQAVRALRGLNIVGADLVEVSPPFDPAGVTAYVGASLMFELLCAMT
ncbi:MAG: agmatinase [Dinoroseobacter sp.]|nr:agmatinase [Dinoroseobacter sp.]